MSFRYQILLALSAFCLSLVATADAIAQDSEGENSSLTSEQVFEAMMLTSRAFRSASEQIRPSLVTIESLGGVGAVQGKIGGIRKQGEGNSTGVVISSDGLVITSTFNFIQQPPVITVITHDGERRVAKLLGRDDIRKLCLLKIDGVKGLPTPTLLDPNKIKVGQWAVSVGVGYGDTNPAISTGIISAKNRIGGKAIQTDANISPANYGGPLVDIEGRLIGICVPLNPQSNEIGAGVEWYDSGIGFAIPLYGAEKWIARLRNNERIAPAFIGIRYVPNHEGDGILIEQVVKGSAAKKAGLEIGDRIVTVDAQPVNDVMMMKKVLNQFEAGQSIVIGYVPYETTETKSIILELGAPPKPASTPLRN